jgi:hypothetical protein
MLFSTRTFEFRDMETTFFFDFLHLLSLIKIKPNVNFGDKLRFAHICHKTFSFSFSLKENGERLMLINTYHGFHSFQLLEGYCSCLERFNESAMPFLRYLRTTLGSITYL